MQLQIYSFSKSISLKATCAPLVLSRLHTFQSKNASSDSNGRVEIETKLTVSKKQECFIATLVNKSNQLLHILLKHELFMPYWYYFMSKTIEKYFKTRVS
jgi:hypothetical protein